MKTANQPASVLARRGGIAIGVVSGCVWAAIAVAVVVDAQPAQDRTLDIAARVAMEGSFNDSICWWVLNPAETMKRQVEESSIIVAGRAVTNRSRLTTSGELIVMGHEVFVSKETLTEGRADCAVIPRPGPSVEK